MVKGVPSVGPLFFWGERKRPLRSPFEREQRPSSPWEGWTTKVPHPGSLTLLLGAYHGLVNRKRLESRLLGELGFGGIYSSK